MVSPIEVAELHQAFQANSKDIGIGLYHVPSGEIRLGSFDRVTLGQGHQGLADVLGITNNTDWRGFIITSSGIFIPTSHFNLVDGSLAMRQQDAGFVENVLRQHGLIQ